ncbi:MAG: T9SS type A sorting domain-containing protein [Chitinophagaceae bacterium]
MPALVYGQVQTAKYVSMIANSNGYYEYLPSGYSTPGNQATYPVLIFLHGLGELGNGSPAELPRVLFNGPPKVINQGNFPSSFSVNGQTFSFIVISPQFIDWPSPLDINNIINYLTQNYRVNINRIYLTGLSMGGGATWEYAGDNNTYANRVAAILPVCGASWPESSRAYIMAAANLPVWATHNNGDQTVPVWYTNDYITHYQNAPVQSNIAPKKTIFDVNGHDAWTTTYNPTWRENENLNVYEWLLTHQRSNIALPVKLINYSVTKSFSNSVTITWSTAQEQNNNYFTIERSINGQDFTSISQVQATNNFTGSSYHYENIGLSSGTYFYRLSQTDLNGQKTYYDIKEIEIENDIKTASLYPNPANEYMTIELNTSVNGKFIVRIFQNDGKQLKQLQLNKSTEIFREQIVLAGIPSGCHTLEIVGTGFKKNISFIKL